MAFGLTGQYIATLNKGKPTNIYNSLGITSNQYAFAATTYYVFYIIGEIPSNLIIKWSTPRVSTRLTPRGTCLATVALVPHYPPLVDRRNVHGRLQ